MITTLYSVYIIIIVGGSGFIVKSYLIESIFGCGDAVQLYNYNTNILDYFNLIKPSSFICDIFLTITMGKLNVTTSIP